MICGSLIANQPWRVTVEQQPPPPMGEKPPKPPGGSKGACIALCRAKFQGLRFAACVAACIAVVW